MSQSRRMRRAARRPRAGELDVIAEVPPPLPAPASRLGQQGNRMAYDLAAAADLTVDQAVQIVGQALSGDHRPIHPVNTAELRPGSLRAFAESIGLPLQPWQHLRLNTEPLLRRPVTPPPPVLDERWRPVDMRIVDYLQGTERCIVDHAPAESLISRDLADSWMAGTRAVRAVVDQDRWTIRFGTSGEGRGIVHYAIHPLPADDPQHDRCYLMVRTR